MKSTILPRPLQPPLNRQCPHCGKLFALAAAGTEQHDKVGEVKVYCCKSCGRETRYTVNHPPNAV